MTPAERKLLLAIAKDLCYWKGCPGDVKEALNEIEAESEVMPPVPNDETVGSVTRAGVGETAPASDNIRVCGMFIDCGCPEPLACQECLCCLEHCLCQGGKRV